MARGVLLLDVDGPLISGNLNPCHGNPLQSRERSMRRGLANAVPQILSDTGNKIKLAHPNKRLSTPRDSASVERLTLRSIEQGIEHDKMPIGEHKSASQSSAIQSQYGSETNASTQQPGEHLSIAGGNSILNDVELTRLLATRSRKEGSFALIVVLSAKKSASPTPRITITPSRWM